MFPPPASSTPPLLLHWCVFVVEPQVAESLRKRILQLYDKYLQDGGKKVNYRALKADPAFAEFAAATAELQKVKLLR